MSLVDGSWFVLLQENPMKGISFIWHVWRPLNPSFSASLSASCCNFSFCCSSSSLTLLPRAGFAERRRVHWEPKTPETRHSTRHSRVELYKFHCNLTLQRDANKSRCPSTVKAHEPKRRNKLELVQILMFDWSSRYSKCRQDYTMKDGARPS